MKISLKIMIYATQQIMNQESLRVFRHLQFQVFWDDKQNHWIFVKS